MNIIRKPLEDSLAAGHANFVVARATVDRTIILGQERNLRFRAALGADDSVHLARGALRTPARSDLRAVTRATARTTTGLIHQTFLLVKLLFAGGKSELIPAITAFKGLVNETQTRDLLVI
jgi:hypothetical protein